MPARKLNWCDISEVERKKIIYGVRRSIKRSPVIFRDIPRLLKAVFNKNFDFGLHPQSAKFVSMSAIVSNVADELSILKQKEHQSGVMMAIVAACSGSNIKGADLARQLRIDRSTVTRVNGVDVYSYLN
jgi:hypothetical protein